MTQVIHTTDELTAALMPLRSSKTIALVPTMGNLHDGHIELVSIAQQHADIVVASIFVNPTQFGVGEDFEDYPRTLQADVERLSQVQTDFVFAPSVEQMYTDYPNLPKTAIELGELRLDLCGKSRPTHFDGVALIVSKLYNIVRPDVAVFGKKDYQQLALIRQMTQDLSYPIKVVGAPIVRAPDGLALSSRNHYLSQAQRQIAPKLNASLRELAKCITRGEHMVVGYHELIAKTIKSLNSDGFNVDYLQVRTRQLGDPSLEDRQLVVLVAAWLGDARLLDNIEITVEL